MPLESSDTAINAMAPVLENVLVCLTQEYEKRLHAKDHEVKASQHDVKAAQTALKQAQMELYEAHKTLAQNANALPVCESQPGEACLCQAATPNKKEKHSSCSSSCKGSVIKPVRSLRFRV